MQRLHIFTTLTTPSLLSAVSCLLLSIGLLGYYGWHFITERGLFQDALFGPYGLFTLGITNDKSSTSFSLLHNEVTYTGAVVLAAIATGLIVFIIIKAMYAAAAEGASILHLMHSHGHMRPEDYLGVLRAVIIICWLLFIYATAAALLPASIGLLQMGVSDIAIGNLNGSWWCLLALTIVILTLHTHVIFARLLAFRLRLFDNLTAQLVSLEK